VGKDGTITIHPFQCELQEVVLESESTPELIKEASCNQDLVSKEPTFLAI